MSFEENSKNPPALKFVLAPEKTHKKFVKKYGAHIRISRYDYKIVYCQNLTYEGQDCHGLCDPENKTIYIDVDSDSVEETIIHEMLHAEVHEGGFHGTANWNDDVEEIMIQQLAKMITHHFRILKL